tara:strand:- start:1459 stop:1755 length:297 start_codon:yes stop_codon:yes gene_type:complete
MNESAPTLFDPTFLFLIGFFLLMYFFIIRPQNKQRKSHENLITSLEVGDEVVTSGGLLGRINKVGEQFLEITLGDNVRIKIQKNSISNVLPKGTIKSI